MKKHVSKFGERIYPLVRVKVFAPGNIQPKKHVVRAPAGQGFGEKGVQEILAKIADKLESEMPGHDYRLVEIGPAQFNFVWERYNAPAVEAEGAIDTAYVPSESSIEA